MLLKQLSEAFGVSGAEGKVRTLLKKETEGIGHHMTDALGNLYIEKRGTMPTKLMLCAHMDEVGAMVKNIDNNGWLRFDTVGGIDERVLVSKAVFVGPEKVKGVIGAKAIHLQEPGERKIPLKIKNLFIDIGAKNKEDAGKYVKIGDYISFNTEFRHLSEEIIAGKALDDRVGCYIISRLLKNHYDISVIGAFTVQEEIGLRGSAVAANKIKPDIAIVIEGTFASDVPGTDEEYYSTCMGQGPAITLMDNTFIADRKCVNRIAEVASKAGIVFQFRKAAVGGTDAGRIHTSVDGIPTAVVSIPCRYIHSPLSLANINDINGAIELVNALIVDYQERGTI